MIFIYGRKERSIGGILMKRHVKKWFTLKV